MTVTIGCFALVPVQIGDAGYITSPVPEPDPTRVMGDGSVGEEVWVSGTNYPLNKRVILTSTHRVYRDTVGGVSNTSPELDPVRWFDEGPTNKWAWADAQAVTHTVAPSPAVFVLRPGVITDIELFSLQNVDYIRVEMWDEPGGTLVYDGVFATDEIAGSDLHWSLYFEPPVAGETWSIPSLPAWPECEVRITLSSYDGQAVGVGLMALGSYDYLGIGEFGFEVVYRDYGYTVTDKWGNTVRTPGPKAKDLRGTAWLQMREANDVDRVLRRLLDVGAVIVPSLLPEHRWLKTWGLLQPSVMQAAGPNSVILNLDFMGVI